MRKVARHRDRHNSPRLERTDLSLSESGARRRVLRAGYAPPPRVPQGARSNSHALSSCKSATSDHAKHPKTKFNSPTAYSKAQGDAVDKTELSRTVAPSDQWGAAQVRRPHNPEAQVFEKGQMAANPRLDHSEQSYARKETAAAR